MNKRSLWLSAAVLVACSAVPVESRAYQGLEGAKADSGVRFMETGGVATMSEPAPVAAPRREGPSEAARLQEAPPAGLKAAAQVPDPRWDEANHRIKQLTTGMGIGTAIGTTVGVVAGAKIAGTILGACVGGLAGAYVGSVLGGLAVMFYLKATLK
jgi:hypothetical protein